MPAHRIAVLVLLLAVLGVPFALRPQTRGVEPTGDAPTLIAMTPHVHQIRYEFARAFSAWHQRVHGSPVNVDWRAPGGTSEIMRTLEAQYFAAAKSGAVDFSDAAGPRMEPGAIAVDLVFGGGSYDHSRLKRGITFKDASGNDRKLSMSIPAGFTQSQLDEWFGENRIGAQKLYDSEQYWIGSALSGFGIVYNRDVVAKLGLHAPQHFEDLADPAYAGWIVLADPRQSGSITTTMESILANYGWERGWCAIRLMCANARSFSESSARPPVDVSQGEAAAGLAIDFYGRGQSQAVAGHEGPSRVGYVDPRGETWMDADPISVLRGGPNPELARRFIEFTLTEEGQALWQFRPGAAAADGGPPGPERYALRRAPIRRVMYDRHREQLMDPENAFELASDVAPQDWRPLIAPIVAASSIDTKEELERAWEAIRSAKADPGFPSPVREEMERLLLSFPPHTMPDGSVVSFAPETAGAIAASWKSDPSFKTRSDISYVRYYRGLYEEIVRLHRTANHVRSEPPASR